MWLLLRWLSMGMESQHTDAGFDRREYRSAKFRVRDVSSYLYRYRERRLHFQD